MEIVGKIVENIDNQYGYIIDSDGNLYFFTKADIIDDTLIEVNKLVVFKNDNERAVLISSI